LIRYEDGSSAKVSTRLDIDPAQALVDLTMNFPIDTRKISSVILIIPSYGTIPDGLQGAGNKGWTFIDEIIIE